MDHGSFPRLKYVETSSPRHTEGGAKLFTKTAQCHAASLAFRSWQRPGEYPARADKQTRRLKKPTRKMCKS